MTNRDIVLEYLKCFCGGDIDGVQRLLVPDFQLIGPLYQFESRDEYIKSLQHDPPEPSSYEILEIAESEDGVSVFYVYEKPSGKLMIAQFFKLKEGKIWEVLLVFDTNNFA